MRVYTVHVTDGDPEPVAVKEGFSWPAFLFGGFWALWHRMWWTAAGLLAVELAVGVLASVLLDEQAQSLVSLGVAAVIGFLANDLRRRALEHAGYRFDEVVVSHGRDAAEHRYLEHKPELSLA